ncbi:anthranilate phosphoribosyltransferase [Janibacter sp. Soil728]|uniref:anthranilate phosphoribosyltransferase n=1 Tax=Janibacter sp. Soil728 TaxID=1736393 RepID=UPI0006FE3B4C|nr:anthranilate phosphoribosyltransferase [Janibacter sp. Soil728]KRE36831.1 anthranilate phosphoribosyltransferase [Janibacter sp. Soil728]
MTATGTHTWPAVLTTLLSGHDLSSDETSWAMREMMSGDAAPAQIAGFLVALRAKGETVTELRALADVMLEHALPIDVAGPTLDIVGTGGDMAGTVNISTMSSICIAATGVRVVKHGNRASSSKSGSADVLESLGVNLSLPPEAVTSVVDVAGITFCFAQTFHPSFRHTAAPRRDLGVGTALNVLGPMTNPSRPTYSVVGVADERVAPLMAGVFADRGTDALVFRGDDGLDELTVADSSHVWWVAGGQISELTLTPEDVGLQRSPLDSLRGGDADFNAEVARRLFAGRTGPVRDAVVLNAGAAVALSQSGAQLPADPIAAIRGGMDTVEAVLDSGRAAEQLDRWVAATRDASPA